MAESHPAINVLDGIQEPVIFFGDFKKQFRIEYYKSYYESIDRISEIDSEIENIPRIKIPERKHRESILKSVDSTFLSTEDLDWSEDGSQIYEQLRPLFEPENMKEKSEYYEPFTSFGGLKKKGISDDQETRE